MEYIIRKAKNNDIEDIIMLCEAHAAYEKASFQKENAGKACVGVAALSGASEEPGSRFSLTRTSLSSMH